MLSDLASLSLAAMDMLHGVIASISGIFRGNTRTLGWSSQETPEPWGGLRKKPPRVFKTMQHSSCSDNQNIEDDNELQDQDVPRLGGEGSFFFLESIFID
jgi:hypothetical protein